MQDIYYKALQFIENNEWDAAHRLVQDYSDPLSCQIHGYLHRVEEDLSNARYWYRRAGMQDVPNNGLDEELARLFAQLRL
jgi:hypothetical protein